MQTAELGMLQARNAGIPRDQMENFLRGSYLPLPWAMKFHAAARQADIRGAAITETPQLLCGGARGPGKTHATMAQVGLDDCQRRPGLKVLFLRMIQRSAAEAFEDLVLRIFHGIPHHYGNNTLSFPNGSRILMGGYHDERDIAKYLGIQYDAIVIEEATQLSQGKHESIGGSVRSAFEEWRPRTYLTTNPGGVGHVYIKGRFIEPYRKKTEIFTRFFPSTYRDNPFLNPEYRVYLENLKGELGRAWRDGDWDVFEGQALPTFNYDRHTCDWFELPANWPRWRSMDWGSAAPMCVLWWALDPDILRCYIYREMYMTNLTDPQACEIILAMTPADETIPFTYADPSMWAKKTFENIVTSTADEFARHGVPLTRADNDRLSGKRKVDKALANLPDGEPGLVVFRNCPNIIRTLPELIRDKKNPEDVDTTGEDHGYDSIRYGLTNIFISPPEPPKQRESPIAELFGSG